MIKIKNLHKNYGSLEVLKGVNKTIQSGEIVAVIGPSGGGKSTLLRCINLLEIPTEGVIEINGQSITDRKANINKIREKVGMVFQHFNLFPHRTVLENIILAPMKVKQLSKAAAEKKAGELLKTVGLLDKINEYPNKLSGGQKQRIAIARALAMEPEIMLFDEPTSALDPEMVNEVLSVIKSLSKKGMTMMIVTHEMAFARNIATRVFLMDQGNVIEDGSPKEVFENPQHDRTKQFFKKILSQHTGSK